MHILVAVPQKNGMPRGKGIRVYEINNGAWELKQIAKGQVNPSYLCLNEKQDRLYAIHGDFSEVSAYKVAEDGTLTYQNTTETHGTNPVHLTIDRTGKWLFVANLQTGGVFCDSSRGRWISRKRLRN